MDKRLYLVLFFFYIIPYNNLYEITIIVSLLSLSVLVPFLSPFYIMLYSSVPFSLSVFLSWMNRTIIDWYFDRYRPRLQVVSAAKCRPRRRLFKPFPVTPTWPSFVSIFIAIYNCTFCYYHIWVTVYYLTSKGTQPCLGLLTCNQCPKINFLPFKKNRKK